MPYLLTSFLRCGGSFSRAFFPSLCFSYSSFVLLVEYPKTNFKTNMASVESVKDCVSSDKIEDPYKGAWEYLDANNILYLIQGLTEGIVKHRPDDPLEFLVHNLTEKDDNDKKENKTKETETTKASDT